MANLTVDQLNQIVQSGAIESLYSGGIKSTGIEQGGVSGSSAREGAEAGKTFSEVLKQSMEKVNLYQEQADTAIKELVAGRTKNIHETMLTIERADTSLRLMMQVRNKILDAYKEIMRMQV